MKTLFAKIMGVLTAGCFLFSCARIDVPTHAENQTPTAEMSAAASEPIAALSPNKQLSTAIKEGLSLEFDALSFVIPASVEGKENRIDLSDASAAIRLNEPSLHGLDFYLDAQLDYNGAKKDINFLLQEDELYFSLTDDRCDYASGNGGFRYKTTLSCYDEGECDETTRGICYFEYGALDYFLYSVFESFGIDSFSLANSSEESSFFIDLGSIVDGTNEIQEINAHYFVWNLPIGEENLAFGLSSDSRGTLNRIDFPYGASEYEFSNGMKLSFSAKISAESYAKALPFDENTYLRLEDSLALVRRIGSVVSDKKFGIDASISVTHTEDEVIGDDTHFQRDAISEVGTLEATADIDLTSSYHDVNAALSFASSGNTETALLHIDDEADSPECYFDFNGVLKGYSNVSVLSALFSTLTESLSDEGIQNETILRLLSGLLATSDSITEAINGIKNSAVYESLGEGHYEGILNALESYGHDDNEIHFTLNLAHAGGHGKAIVRLSSDDASLLSVSLIEAGIVTSNSPKLSLLLSGSIVIRDYLPTEFEKVGYAKFEHLPSLESSLKRFTATDQLAVSLEGYMLKRGTTASASYSAPSWIGSSNFSQQGFTFSGSLGFDLTAKTGTGKMDFTDRKEKYYNAHHLAIDVTGPETSEGGNMLFQYSSDGAENGPLMGRISIASMDEILDTVTQFLTSTDPRFKRITNLFNSIMTKSTIGSIVSGKYLEAIANGFLSASTIDNSANTATLEFKPGLIKEGYGLKVRVAFESDYEDDGEIKPGKLKTLEILSESPKANEGTDIYARITFLSADFSVNAPDYNWMDTSYSLNSFTDYSSLSDLLDAVLNTFTLGVDEENEQYESTYHVTGKISLSVLSKINFDVNADFYISVDGTNVKIIGNLDLPIFEVLNSKNSSSSTAGTIWNGITTVLGSGDEEGHRYVSLYYWASGNDDAGGVMLIDRFDHYHGKEQSITKATSDSWQEVRVLLAGEEFGSDLLGYLLKDIFGFNSWIMDQIGSTESSSSSALHGEDIVKSFAFTNSSTSPKWNLTLGVGALANTSLLGDVKLQIGGMNIGNGNYALAEVSTAEDLSILSVIKASLSFKIANISSSGYSACFDNSISVADHGNRTSKSYKYLFSSYTVDRYSIAYANGSARSLYSSRFISKETLNEDGTVTYNYGTRASGLAFATASSSHY